MIGLNYVHLAGNGTTTITPDATTYLWTLNINSVAASSTVTVYDGQNASGTKIAVVDGSTVASKAYGVRAMHGLTVVIAGGSGNNPDVTIGYP